MSDRRGPPTFDRKNRNANRCGRHTQSDGTVSEMLVQSFERDIKRLAMRTARLGKMSHSLDVESLHAFLIEQFVRCFHITFPDE